MDVEERFITGKTVLDDGYLAETIIDTCNNNRYYDGRKSNYHCSIEIADLLNRLHQENKQLKLREHQLLNSIDDFQELLTKNDTVCHKRVIRLIDDKLIENEALNGVDTAMYNATKSILKELKKELTDE